MMRRQDPGELSGNVDRAQLRALAKRLEAAGVDGAVLSAFFDGFLPDADVLARVQTQPEHARTPGAYVEMLATAERAGKARTIKGELSDTLGAIGATFGVPGDILLAIWGIESRFGAAMGRTQTVCALATLALCHTRRAAFWEDQLAAVFDVAGELDLDATDLRGSWAGALGHTQFMPRTWLQAALDFDGDGKRDLIGSSVDALASAANLLARSGWQRDLVWGGEVFLPDAFDYATVGPDGAMTLSEWRTLGVSPVQPRNFEAGWETGGRSGVRVSVEDQPHAFRLIMPEGHDGPQFLVSVNFDAILQYNAAVPYALAVGLLSNAIGRRPGLVRPWRNPDDALTLAERTSLQAGLVALGWATGGIDGILGAQSLSAIREFQSREGMVADGYASRSLLAAIERAVAARQGAADC